MGKKPKVFANKIEKNIRNNKSVFDSSRTLSEDFAFRNSNDERSSSDDLAITDKITRLLNRDGYVFNVDVLIKTRDGDFNTHIAGIVNNHIITLDNDIINIDDVIDIKY